MNDSYCLLKWNKIHREEELNEKLDFLIRMRFVPDAPTQGQSHGGLSPEEKKSCVLENYKTRLPQTFRSNAVTAVIFNIHIYGKSESWPEFFGKSILWLKEKLGTENYLFFASGPNGLYVGFIPLVNGKLNARKLLNGTYKDLYLELCEKIGKPFGLKPYPKEKANEIKKSWFDTPFYPEEDKHDGKAGTGSIEETGASGTGEQQAV